MGAPDARSLPSSACSRPSPEEVAREFEKTAVQSSERKAYPLRVIWKALSKENSE